MRLELTPQEAAAELGRHVSTLYQYLRGIPVNGHRIRLAGTAVGGRWRITREAIEDFRRQCTAAARGERPPPPQTAPGMTTQHTPEPRCPMGSRDDELALAKREIDRLTEERDAVAEALRDVLHEASDGDGLCAPSWDTVDHAHVILAKLKGGQQG